MAVLFYLPNAAPVSSGRTYPGARLFFYESGTSTAAVVYSDELVTAHTQPVVADSSGVFPPIYLDPTQAYRVVLQTSAGVTLRDVDPIPAAPSSEIDVGESLWPKTSKEAGVTISNYNYPPGNVLRYGAVADGATDCRAAFQAAINANYSGEVFVPAGEYLLNSVSNGAAITITERVRIVGEYGSFIKYGAGLSATDDVFRISPGSADVEGVEFENLWVYERTGTPGRDVVRIALDATHGLKKFRVHRCLFRSAAGYAISCFNNGELNPNGLFFTQITQSELGGGIRLEGLGDSNEISDNVITGANPGVRVIMLSPAAPDGTSAKLGIRRNNITATGGAILIERGRNVTIEDNNIEQTAALNDGVCVELGLIDYDVTGISTIRGNKIEPADPISVCGGLSLYRGRGTIIEGNHIGTSAKAASFTTAVALLDCDDVRVRGNEFYLSTDCVGVSTDADTTGTIYERGKITATGTYTELSDSGTGTVVATKASGTFTGSLTGCTTVPTGTIRYVVSDESCTLYIPAISATSNTTAATITGAPTAIRPARAQTVLARVTDNNAAALGGVTVGTDGVLTLAVGATLGVFTGSGTKGIPVQTITYSLD